MKLSLKRVYQIVVILMVCISGISAESREIKSQEDTIRVIRGKVSLLAFPDSVKQCIVDNGIEAVISGNNVYITAKKQGRVFVSLASKITVPLVVKIESTAPASYNFYYHGIKNYTDTSFYDEVAALTSALYHREVIANYAMKKINRKVEIKIGENKYPANIDLEFVGNYFGYVLTFTRKIDSIPENLLYEPGIIAISIDSNKAFIIASRELYDKEQ